jgi:hypothetical protein
MRLTTILSIAFAGALLACSSSSGPPADRIVYRTSDAPAPSIDAMESTRTRQQVPQLNDMTEGERIAWFQSHGVYPYPWYPSRDDQTLGYVHTPTDTGWILPTILAAGALYGLYRVKRHNDW